MADKEVKVLLKHIRKQREELRHKDGVIKRAYDNLLHNKWCSNTKIAYTANILKEELRRQNEKDRILLKRLNKLFIEAGEDPVVELGDKDHEN